MPPVPPRLIRKAIHFLTGMLIFALSWMVPREILLWLIVGGTLFSFFTFRYRKFYLLHKTSDASLGTLFYPLGILSAYLMLYYLPMYYFQTALLVLTVSDSMANIVGHIKKGNGSFRILGDSKSMHGIAAFVVSTMAVVFILLPLSSLVNVGYVFFVVLLAVAMEVISFRGSDNFTIPASLAGFFILSERFQLDYMYLSAVFLFMSVGCIMLFRWRLLTRAGSFAAWLLGLYLLVFGGYQWTLPVVAFFITSVVFTKIRSGIRGKEKKTIGRNAWQVVANILWAFLSSLFLMLTGDVFFLYLFIAYVAAVTADTWASELGPVFHKKSFSLAHMRMLEAGATGGISFAGTLAAWVGAFAISGFSYWLIFSEWNLTLIMMISLSAFLACFVDTLLGAFVEDKLLNAPYFQSHTGPESITPNDLVNLGGSLTAGLLFWGMWLLF